MNAKYDLNLITNLINSGKVGFISPSRSKNIVGEIFPHFTEDEIEKFIINGILTLIDIDFVETRMLWDLICDVYGKNINNINWYIKFAVEADENGTHWLSEISFHPIEKDLKLQSGIVLKKE